MEHNEINKLQRQCWSIKKNVQHLTNEHTCKVENLKSALEIIQKDLEEKIEVKQKAIALREAYYVLAIENNNRYIMPEIGLTEEYYEDRKGE